MLSLKGSSDSINGQNSNGVPRSPLSMTQTLESVLEVQDFTGCGSPPTMDTTGDADDPNHHFLHYHHLNQKDNQTMATDMMCLSETEQELYNSPKFLQTTQKSLRTSPTKSSPPVPSTPLFFHQHSHSTNTSPLQQAINHHNQQHHPLQHSTSFQLNSNNKSRLIGFTRSTSHSSFLNSQDSSFDSSSPSTPNLSEDHQMESSPKMTQRRMIRNEKARSSPPLSPSSFLRGQNQNDSFSSCSSINSSNSYNNDFKARNENSLVPLSPSSLLPGVEQLVESSNNNNNNNNQNNSNSNFSPSRSRSNSRGVLYSPRSRSPSITPTSSPSSSCKNIPPPSTPPIPIISNGSNRLDPISESLLTSDANVMSTPITQNLASLRLNGSSSIQITPATPITPISLSSRHVTINDFTLIEKIGEGGFGQVYLAKKQDTGEVVALKRMSKDLIWSKNKISHIKNERDILAQGKNHRYIVSLVYSFQDDQYLYLAMEYVAGGDLRSLLSAIGCLDEENAKFYMAEMVEAVDSCHTLGYCHRDLKPENFLIDKTGHIKLADFGLSKMFTRYVKSAKGTPGPNPAVLEHTPMKFSSNSLSTSVTDFSGFGSFKDISLQARLAYSVVGSPFYMAPEVLQATTGYGDEVDWWSLGCMFYEFICGVPPFDGDSPEEVMETVLKWKSNLQRPPNISDDLWSLITGLITDGNTRLGTGERGVENIKSHPFFSGVSWGMLHENEPPFVPLLEDDFDTTYFEKDRERAVVYTNRNSGGTVSTYKGKANRNILGFTYPRAGDDPLVWSNMLKGLTTEQNNENNINKLKTSLNHLTPPGASPSSNDTNQESTSPYSTYRNKFSLTEMNLELSNKEPWN